MALHAGAQVPNPASRRAGPGRSPTDERRAPGPPAWPRRHRARRTGARPLTRAGVARSSAMQHGAVAAPARRVVHADLAHPVRRQMRVEVPGGDLGAPPARSPKRSTPGAACPGRPRSRSSARRPGTTTSSAHASATQRSWSRLPRCCVEQVGWSTAEPVRRAIVSRGSSSSAAQATESMTVSRSCNLRLAGLRYGTTSWPRPSVQDEASTTSGSSPPSVQRQAASTIRLAMSALPDVVPLGVPDRSRSTSPPHRPGIHTGRPARARDDHHGLRQRRPVVACRPAEDPVHTRRVVDGRRTRTVRWRAAASRAAPGNLRQPLGYEIGAYGLTCRTRQRLQRRSPRRGSSRVRSLSAAATASRADLSTAAKCRAARAAVRSSRGGVPPVPEVLHHRAGVDADRAGQRAGRVARAGVDRVVAVGVQQARR